MGWSNIVTEEKGTVSVNLLLSKGSKWLDVSSYLPHEGKLVLDIHEDIAKLQVRIPDWAGFNQVVVEREQGGKNILQSGKDNSSWVKQRFLRITKVSQGERIAITFPLSEYKTMETAIGEHFEVTWRGDDVIYIRPEGKYKPLYNQRKVYDKAPMKEGSYLRVDEELYW